jgi:hypothetical protein
MIVLDASATVDRRLATGYCKPQQDNASGTVSTRARIPCTPFICSMWRLLRSCGVWLTLLMSPDRKSVSSGLTTKLDHETLQETR